MAGLPQILYRKSYTTTNYGRTTIQWYWKPETSLGTKIITALSEPIYLFGAKRSN